VAVKARFRGRRSTGMLAGLVLALSAGEVPHAIGQRTRTRILSAVDETLGTAAPP
jgi:hypothetical protein